MKSKLNVATMHVRQVKNNSHGSQQCCNEDRVYIANGGNPTSIGGFNLDNISISRINKKQTSEFLYSIVAEFIN